MKRYFVALTLSITLLGILVSSAQAQVGRGKFGLGLSLSGNTLQSDWRTNDLGFGGSADISYSFGYNWGVVSALGIDQFQGVNNLNQNVVSTVFRATLALSYEFLPDNPMNPFVFVGGGWMLYTPRVVDGGGLISGRYPPYDLLAFGGVGVDYYVSESWSIIVRGGAGMMGTDAADGSTTGSNDLFGHVSVGIRYYLFDRSTVEKIVDSVRR